MTKITPRFQGLGKRLLSALVLVPLVVLWNRQGGFAFAFGLALVSALMAMEWWRITHRIGVVITLAGLPTILLTAFCLLQIRLVSLPAYGGNPAHPQLGMHLIFGIIALIAAVDVGGYLFGKCIGGPKMAPRISPNKTWAGLVGAMLCAGMLFLVLQAGLPAGAVRFPAWLALLAGAVFALVAQSGDLLESWLKRLSGLKDSGGILPGHGGLLDRLDGYLTAVPLAYGWCLWQGWL